MQFVIKNRLREDCMDLVKKTEITAFIPNLSGGGAQGVFVTIMDYYVDIGCKVKYFFKDTG